MKRIAIFHSGELTINAYYLAIALRENSVEVDFYLYTPRNSYKKTFLVNLLDKVKKEFKTFEFTWSFVDNSLNRLNLHNSILKHSLSPSIINPVLKTKTNRYLKGKDYNYVITVGQNSLYWLYIAQPQLLRHTIHYSLEVQKPSDPHFITPFFATILKWESLLLKRIKGLIIQDKFRAEALLNSKIEKSNLLFFFIPVSVPGEVIRKKKQYLHECLQIPIQKNIVLYFGALYLERFIKEISDNFLNNTNDSCILVLHGPNDFSEVIWEDPKIKTSHKLLDYEDLHQIISSATIGLAFYDNSWSNTRYTAFSSEKIARYLQCGVPFVAFENESYLKLKNEFNCCVLIDNMSNLNNAIEQILENYEEFQDNCFKAFIKYYDIHSSIAPLIDFIQEN